MWSWNGLTAVRGRRYSRRLNADPGTCSISSATAALMIGQAKVCSCSPMITAQGRRCRLRARASLFGPFFAASGLSQRLRRRPDQRCRNLLQRWRGPDSPRDSCGHLHAVRHHRRRCAGVCPALLRCIGAWTAGRRGRDHGPNGPQYHDAGRRRMGHADATHACA